MNEFEEKLEESISAQQAKIEKIKVSQQSILSILVVLCELISVSRVQSEARATESKYQEEIQALKSARAADDRAKKTIGDQIVRSLLFTSRKRVLTLSRDGVVSDKLLPVSLHSVANSILLQLQSPISLSLNLLSPTMSSDASLPKKHSTKPITLLNSATNHKSSSKWTKLEMLFTPSWQD